MGNNSCCDNSRENEESFILKPLSRMTTDIKKDKIQDIKMKFIEPDKLNQASAELTSRLEKLPQLRGYHQITNSKFDLQGPMRCSDGSTYFGEIREGEKHGYGDLIKKDGSFYIGYFKNDQFSGLGRLADITGIIYQGNFQNGEKNGFGEQYYTDGMIAIGEWKNGLLDGEGHITYPDKSFYKGQFKNGLPHGEGELFYLNKYRYIGQFIDGRFSGFGKDIIHLLGKISYHDGGKYEGEWINDKIHGRGAFSYASGHVYNGNYANNKKDGYGELLLYCLKITLVLMERESKEPGAKVKLKAKL